MTSMTKGARSAVVRVLCLLAVLAIVQGCEQNTPPPAASTSFTYEPAKGLSPKERAVETRFAKAIADNLNVFIAAYRWKWPKVINTDNARELCQQYAPDGFGLMTANNKKHRTEYALGTQAPARALAKEVYKQMLKERPTANEQPLVVFTAGGAGSGKSTSIASVEQLQDIHDQAQIIVDTTLSSGTALDQIKMALDAGKSVKIFYIYRDPKPAFMSVLERATRTGRPVTISNFIETHLGAPAALDKIAKNFSDELKDGKIEVQVIDNTGGPDDAKLAQNGVQFVRTRTAQYSEKDLKRQLGELLKESYGKEEISKALFETMDR